MTNTFNTYFNVKDERYLNIPIDTDILRFVDPVELRKAHSKYFNGILADRKLRDYIEEVFIRYKDGNPAAAFNLINDPPGEVNAVHLGYSSNQSRGNGTSAEILDATFKKILELSEHHDKFLRAPILVPLFVPRFGSDRFSDLIVNVITKELCEFTEKICDELNIEIRDFSYRYYDNDEKAWKDEEFLLPEDANGHAIILIPENVAVEDYNFKAQNFVETVVIPNKQDEHYENGTMKHFIERKGQMVAVKPTKKMVRKEEVSDSYVEDKYKQYALDETLKNPDLLGQFIKNIGMEE